MGTVVQVVMDNCSDYGGELPFDYVDYYVASVPQRQSVVRLVSALYVV